MSIEITPTIWNMVNATTAMPWNYALAKAASEENFTSFETTDRCDSQQLIQDLRNKERILCEKIVNTFLLGSSATVSPQTPLTPQSLALSTFFTAAQLVTPSLTTTSTACVAQGHETMPTVSPISPPAQMPAPAEYENGDSDLVRDRPHSCEFCGKHFRYRSNLFEHRTLHQSSRPRFACPFCPRSCRLKGNLKKHMQLHVKSQEELEQVWKLYYYRGRGRPSKNAPQEIMQHPLFNLR
ncbi:laterally symmetric protein 2 [Aphelenchoides avenae]|nr:laterally symmetric protein 2 [Aphelenchus avenae]